MAFRDMRFPSVKMAPSGGPIYRSTRLKSPSGRRQRNIEHDEPSFRWSVAAQSWDDEKLNDLLAFFHVVGSEHSFRFRDPSDYTCGMVRDGNGWEHDEPHVFGIGDTEAVNFQLTKTYEVGVYTRVRKITLPVEGTVKIYRLGLELGPSAYEIDYTTGIVTFDLAYDEGDELAWSGMFDIHAELEGDAMDLTKDSIAMGTWPVTIISVSEGSS